MLRKNFLGNELVVSDVLKPRLSASTTDETSASVDVRGYASTVLRALFGASGDTLSSSVKVEAELQHSDDDSTFAACADTDLVNADTGAAGAVTGTNTGTFAVVDAAADDDQAYAARYVGDKPYVRVVLNKTGTHTNGIPVACEALQAAGETP